MPAGGDRSIRIVLLKKIPVGVNDVAAESIKHSGQSMVGRNIQGISDKRTVTGPEITVVVGCAFRYIPVIGGKDRTAVVDLGSHDEQTPLIKADDLRREITEVS